MLVQLIAKETNFLFFIWLVYIMFHKFIALFTNDKVTRFPCPLVFHDYFLIMSICMSILKRTNQENIA